MSAGHQAAHHARAPSIPIVTGPSLSPGTVTKPAPSWHLSVLSSASHTWVSHPLWNLGKNSVFWFAPQGYTGLGSFPPMGQLLPIQQLSVATVHLLWLSAPSPPCPPSSQNKEEDKEGQGSSSVSCNVMGKTMISLAGTEE